MREDSTITTNEQVDVEGVRIMVGKGSAYDLHLTRELKNARQDCRHGAAVVHLLTPDLGM